MCVNYHPTPREAIATAFHADLQSEEDWKSDVWKDYAAPIIRSAAPGERIATVANYGMIPRRFLPPEQKPYQTTNARSETVGQKPAYAKAWRSGSTCLIPCRAFFEPRYEDGKNAVWWGIKVADLDDFAVAGLWREWTEADGARSVSFTQLTINADSCPFMNKFHAPGDEKRSLVIIPPDEYDAWLSCRDPEVARSFLRLFPAERLVGWPAPRPPRRAKPKDVPPAQEQLALGE